MLAIHMKPIILFIIVTIFLNVNASRDWSNDKKPERWNKYASDKIRKILNRDINGNVAKNIILFLGDGMGLPTVTAGRILKGQLKGDNGEEEVTFMESLDHVALSKTYNIDAQTPDSAGTATAYLTGVKTGISVVGLDGSAVDCATSKQAELESILKWAHYAGKATGIVTNTRVTHATPAGTYAHSLDREWEAYDGKKFGEELHKQGCRDIASQLVERNSFINVIFGGGRRKFLSTNDSDFADPKLKGDRIDRRNLIEEWEDQNDKKGLRHKFLWNMEDFGNLRANEYDHVLGLFNHNHMSFELDRVQHNLEPSLIDMTKKAIELLEPNPNGFFLLVEGGNIDRAHHKSMAKKSLHEYVVFDDAIGAGLNATSEEDTLIVATADHSHVFSLGGYGIRGLDLFGTNINKWSNLSNSNLTYTPLVYGNGPGALLKIRDFNLTSDMTNASDYQQESAVYFYDETHGGEDVAIYANGPMSYLFTGTVEQNFIAHVMAYSGCIGPYNSTDCAEKRGRLVKSSAVLQKNSIVNLIICLLVLYFVF